MRSCKTVVLFALCCLIAATNAGLFREIPERAQQQDVLALPEGEVPEVPAPDFPFPDGPYDEEQQVADDVILPDIQEEAPEQPEEENAFIVPLSKPLGEISGLGLSSKGNLIVFHRGEREWNEKTFTEDFKLSKSLSAPIANTTIAVVDPTSGQVTAEYGANQFYLPHGLTIDHEDNVWLTDVGTHQVHKLDKDFKVQLTLGEKLVPGHDDSHFCQPTDVAVAKNGFFFVADGYCNSRVLKFDPTGKLVAVIQSDIDGFIVPHSLSLIEDLNLLCVADRENERVQCFSAGLKEGHRSIPTGILITSADSIGRVFAIREKEHYLVGVTGADEEGSLLPQVFVMDMNNGQARTFVKGIENAHAVAVSSDGTVYIGQMHPNQIVALQLIPNQN